MLEPYAVKVACTVLRGGGAGNSTSLPDPSAAGAEYIVMTEPTRVPAFRVHKVTLGGLIPIGRYFHCIYCDQDLTDWVMKQPPAEVSACPNCQARIEERDIAQAQRDTKLGCLWTVLSVVVLILLVLIPTVIAKVLGK